MSPGRLFAQGEDFLYRSLARQGNGCPNKRAAIIEPQRYAGCGRDTSTRYWATSTQKNRLLAAQ